MLFATFYDIFLKTGKPDVPPFRKIRRLRINHFVFGNTNIAGHKNHTATIKKSVFKNQGGFAMTEKELLYIEDALGHEEYFKAKCAETAQNIRDTELKGCIEQIQQKHQQIFNTFYGLL